MSLDTVVEDIRDEARARAEEISEEGERRAEEIISEAEADADEIREQAEQDIERTIEQEREQELSSAKLQAKQERLEARRDMLEQVRDRVEDDIAEMSGEQREQLTRELLESTTGEFDDDDAVAVYGAPSDEELLNSLLEEFGGYSYAGEYECLGGVVVESEESRVRVNNTFDSIIDTVWDENLKEVSDSLFEQ
jgi:V/A-type H+-transporting ATPase subunit E